MVIAILYKWPIEFLSIDLTLTLLVLNLSYEI